MSIGKNALLGEIVEGSNDGLHWWRGILTAIVDHGEEYELLDGWAYSYCKYIREVSS